MKQCKVVPSDSSLSRELGRVLVLSSSLERLDPDSLVVVCVENSSRIVGLPDLVDEGFSRGFGEGDVNRHTRYNYNRDEDRPESGAGYQLLTHL